MTPQEHSNKTSLTSHRPKGSRITRQKVSSHPEARSFTLGNTFSMHKGLLVPNVGSFCRGFCFFENHKKNNNLKKKKTFIFIRTA